MTNLIVASGYWLFLCLNSGIDWRIRVEHEVVSEWEPTGIHTENRSFDRCVCSWWLWRERFMIHPVTPLPPSHSLHPWQYTRLPLSVLLSLCLRLSLFPVLCFKAEACVTHSTWHVKPLSCLEPGVREKWGERREERKMWMWGWASVEWGQSFFPPSV